MPVSTKTACWFSRSPSPVQYPVRRAFPPVAAFAAALPLLAPALAFAQAAAPVLSPKPAAVAVEDLGQLSAFNVTSTQDSIHAAMNSTTATRIDMPIKDIPVNNSVVTRQFLDDSLAFDFRDALNYNAGVITRRDEPISKRRPRFRSAI